MVSHSIGKHTETDWYHKTVL